jgi:hypothetical protein
VLLVDQACTTLVLLPSNNIHLNCCGAVPPDTDAVNVTGVPTGCGAVRFAVSPVIDSGGVVGFTGNATLPFDCGLS